MDAKLVFLFFVGIVGVHCKPLETSEEEAYFNKLNDAIGKLNDQVAAFKDVLQAKRGKTTDEASKPAVNDEVLTSLEDSLEQAVAKDNIKKSKVVKDETIVEENVKDYDNEKQSPAIVLKEITEAEDELMNLPLDAGDGKPEDPKEEGEKPEDPTNDMMDEETGVPKEEEMDDMMDEQTGVPKEVEMDETWSSLDSFSNDDAGLIPVDDEKPEDPEEDDAETQDDSIFFNDDADFTGVDFDFDEFDDDVAKLSDDVQTADEPKLDAPAETVQIPVNDDQGRHPDRPQKYEIVMPEVMDPEAERADAEKEAENAEVVTVVKGIKDDIHRIATTFKDMKEKYGEILSTNPVDANTKLKFDMVKADIKDVVEQFKHIKGEFTMKKDQVADAPMYTPDQVKGVLSDIKIQLKDASEQLKGLQDAVVTAKVAKDDAKSKELAKVESKKDDEEELDMLKDELKDVFTAMKSARDIIRNEKEDKKREVNSDAKKRIESLKDELDSIKRQVIDIKARHEDA